MFKLLIQILVTVFLFINTGCGGDAGFTGGDESFENNSLSIEDGVVTERFQWTGKTNENLDVVWVIDNSGSMDAEVAHIRQNFAKFIDYVQNRSNLKLALITADEASDDNGVTLQPAATSPNYLQINQNVGSNEGLEITLENLENELGTFLRPDAEKAFVFVTDDESDDVSADEFSQAIKTKYPNSGFVAHGFVSLGDALSPCGADQGQEYQTLSLASAGKTFNICDKVWDQHFETLAKAVAGQVQSQFQLASAINLEDILNVKVNGTEIPATAFSVDGQTLSIAPSALSSDQDNEIEISYKEQ